MKLEENFGSTVIKSVGVYFWQYGTVFYKNALLQTIFWWFCPLC